MVLHKLTVSRIFRYHRSHICMHIHTFILATPANISNNLKIAQTAREYYLTYIICVLKYICTYKHTLRKHFTATFSVFTSVMRYRLSIFLHRDNSTKSQQAPYLQIKHN